MFNTLGNLGQNKQLQSSSEVHQAIAQHMPLNHTPPGRANPSPLPAKPAPPARLPALAGLNPALPLNPVPLKQKKTKPEDEQYLEKRSQYAYTALQKAQENPETHTAYQPFEREQELMPLLTDPSKINSQLAKTAKDLANLLEAEDKWIQIKSGRYNVQFNAEIYKNLQAMKGNSLKALKARIANLEDKKNVIPSLASLINMFAAAYNIIIPPGVASVAQSKPHNEKSILAISYIHHPEDKPTFIPLGHDLDMTLRHKLYHKLKQDSGQTMALAKIFRDQGAEKYLNMQKLITLREIAQKITDLKKHQDNPPEFKKTLGEIKESLKDINSVYEQIRIYCDASASGNYPEYLEILKNPEFEQYLSKFTQTLNDLAEKLAQQDFTEEPALSTNEQPSDSSPTPAPQPPPRNTLQKIRSLLKKHGLASPKISSLEILELNKYFEDLQEETIKDTLINWPLMGRLKDGRVSSFSETLAHLVHRSFRYSTLDEETTPANPEARTSNFAPETKEPKEDEPSDDEGTIEIFTTLTQKPTFQETQQHMSAEVNNLLNEFHKTRAHIKSLREQYEQLQHALQSREDSSANPADITISAVRPSGSSARSASLPRSTRDSFVTEASLNEVEQEYQRTLSENSKFAHRFKQTQQNAAQIDDLLNKLQAEFTKLTDLHSRIHAEKLRVEQQTKAYQEHLNQSSSH